MKNAKITLRILISLFLLLPCLFHPGTARGEAKPELRIEIAAQRETTVLEKGKPVTKLEAADRTSPGDTLVYTITYSNTGHVDALRAEIIDPIPQGVLYMEKSAGGKDAKITFSIDDGATFHTPPIYYKTINKEGQEVKMEAGTERYTHIKWQISRPLKSGQKGTLNFKARVK
jgi:uncharacterized repeat protein (TIGR01451 family)